MREPPPIQEIDETSIDALLEELRNGPGNQIKRDITPPRNTEPSLKTIKEILERTIPEYSSSNLQISKAEAERIQKDLDDIDNKLKDRDTKETEKLKSERDAREYIRFSLSKDSDSQNRHNFEEVTLDLIKDKLKDKSIYDIVEIVEESKKNPKYQIFLSKRKKSESIDTSSQNSNNSSKFSASTDSRPIQSVSSLRAKFGDKSPQEEAELLREKIPQFKEQEKRKKEEQDIKFQRIEEQKIIDFFEERSRLISENNSLNLQTKTAFQSNFNLLKKDLISAFFEQDKENSESKFDDLINQFTIFTESLFHLKTSKKDIPEVVFTSRITRINQEKETVISFIGSAKNRFTFLKSIGITHEAEHSIINQPEWIEQNQSLGTRFQSSLSGGLLGLITGSENGQPSDLSLGQAPQVPDSSRANDSPPLQVPDSSQVPDSPPLQAPDSPRTSDSDPDSDSSVLEQNRQMTQESMAGEPHQDQERATNQTTFQTSSIIGTQAEKSANTSGDFQEDSSGYPKIAYESENLAGDSPPQLPDSPTQDPSTSTLTLTSTSTPPSTQPPFASPLKPLEQVYENPTTNILKYLEENLLKSILNISKSSEALLQDKPSSPMQFGSTLQNTNHEINQKKERQEDEVAEAFMNLFIRTIEDSQKEESEKTKSQSLNSKSTTEIFEYENKEQETKPKEPFDQNQILNNAKTIIQHLYSEHQKLSQKIRSIENGNLAEVEEKDSNEKSSNQVDRNPIIYCGVGIKMRLESEEKDGEKKYFLQVTEIFENSSLKPDQHQNKKILGVRISDREEYESIDSIYKKHNGDLEKFFSEISSIFYDPTKAEIDLQFKEENLSQKYKKQIFCSGLKKSVDLTNSKDVAEALNQKQTLTTQFSSGTSLQA